MGSCDKSGETHLTFRDSRVGAQKNPETNHSAVSEGSVDHLSRKDAAMIWPLPQHQIHRTNRQNMEPSLMMLLSIHTIQSVLLVPPEHFNF